MKRVLMIIAMGFFISAHADSLQSSHKLNVDILNLGAENCHLMNAEILNGEMSKGTIPGYLPGTGMVFHFQIGLKNVKSSKASYTDAELKLTYECGTDKHITLYMKQSYKHNHHNGQMLVKATEVQDVYETHEVSAPERRVKDLAGAHPHPGYIRWTLWN